MVVRGLPLILMTVQLLTCGVDCPAQSHRTPRGGALDGDRLRVIVSTDIGGSDPDDFQSMVHFLMYADCFEIEGLIASPPDRGRVEHLHEVIEVYARDHARLLQHRKTFPSPDHLRAVSKQGAHEPAPEAGWSEPTGGSDWIVQCARRKDARPLYVLVWGSITDVAQAVHDAPDIKAKLRVYFISSWNRSMDKAARQYLFDHHPDLWWIESDTTFRGMYVGGEQEGDLGNRAFLDEHVRGHGALGDFLVGKLSHIKMGDTPSVLYVLAGDPNDPTGDHWGGSYIGTDHGPHYWTDRQDSDLREKNYPGARTVSRWRAEWLRDWRTRMDWLREEESR